MPCDEVSLDLNSKPSIHLREMSWPILRSTKLDLEAVNRIKSHTYVISFLS